MGQYADIHPGEAVPHTARRENDISHLLNGMNGFCGGVTTPASNVLKIGVYNAGAVALPAGKAVNFVSSGGMTAFVSGGLIPCSAVSDINSPWGVLTERLEPNQAGTCVVAGPVTVARIEGSGGEYAMPVIGSGAIVSGAQVYSRGVDGAPILFASASGGVILLGGGGGGVGEAQAYKVVQAPTGGVGVGLVQNIRFTGGGAGYETVGDPVPKFFCHIGGPLV